MPFFCYLLFVLWNFSFCCVVQKYVDLAALRGGLMLVCGITFELTGILRWAGFGLGFFSPNLDCRKMSG